MVSFTLHFPLGAYFTGSPRADDPAPGAEWPPSPVRLVGALLAAAHEVPSDDLDADRAVLDKLCGATAPLIVAPTAAPWAEAGDGEVAVLAGTVRWAPRNPDIAEMKSVSPYVISRGSTEVVKGGVAIGDRPVSIAWPDVELSADELVRLRRMATDVAWLGTSRSPVVLTVDDTPPEGDAPVWRPLPWATPTPRHQVRVPTPDLLARFDTAYATRRSRKDRVESSGLLAPANGGRWWPYTSAPEDAGPFDPRHWGDMTIVALDDDSEVRPRTPATYLVARAFRAALLKTFPDGDAPGVLHGHGDEPHAAFVPLPFVGRPHADGVIRGVAIVFPHADRLPDVEAQRRVVDAHVASLLGAWITLPGAGCLNARQPNPGRNRLATLAPGRYIGPARRWTTVTPVVHSRWLKHGDVLDQVARDCAHVGLPAPAEVEVLRGPAVAGGAGLLLAAKALPEAWRRSVDGPTSHLRLTFDEPVPGPIVLGRARHFGVGLLVPETGGDE